MVQRYETLSRRTIRLSPNTYVKEGSTSHLGLLYSGEKKETALLGARNRYALRLADHQRSSPNCTGWDRLNAMFSIPNLKPYLHESAESKD